MVPATNSERKIKFRHGVLRKSNGLLEGAVVSFAN
jgi:hypothetical protein